MCSSLLMYLKSTLPLKLHQVAMIARDLDRALEPVLAARVGLAVLHQHLEQVLAFGERQSLQAHAVHVATQRPVGFRESLDAVDAHAQKRFGAPTLADLV